MFKKIIVLTILIICSASYCIYASEYTVGADRGDSNLNGDFSGKSKIFDLESKKDGNDTIISGNFNVQKVYDKNVIIHYSAPLSINGDIVKKLTTSDIIYFDMYKSSSDQRLNEQKKFVVVDEFKFEKPKITDPTDYELEKENMFLGQEFPYDNVNMIKLKDTNSSIYYYVPRVDEKFVNMFYDNKYKNYEIGIDYNVKYNKNVGLYEIVQKDVYENDKWTKKEEYIKHDISLEDFSKKLVSVKKLKFNSNDELIGMYYEEIVIGGIYG